MKTKLEDKKQIIKKLNLETNNLTEKNGQQKTVTEELQNQIEELLAIIAELKCKQNTLDNSLDPDENGGSNGWSDLGDVEVDGTDNSTNGATETKEEGDISDKTSESSKKNEDKASESLKKECKEKSSKKWADNLFEVAKLKTELRKIEAERNNLKYVLIILKIIFKKFKAFIE